MWHCCGKITSSKCTANEATLANFGKAYAKLYDVSIMRLNINYLKYRPKIDDSVEVADFVPSEPLWWHALPNSVYGTS